MNSNSCNSCNNNSNTTNNCAIDSFPVGMCYVPWQKWRDLYNLETALKRGTLFSELDKPFQGGCR